MALFSQHHSANVHELEIEVQLFEMLETIGLINLVVGKIDLNLFDNFSGRTALSSSCRNGSRLTIMVC